MFVASFPSGVCAWDVCVHREGSDIKNGSGEEGPLRSPETPSSVNCVKKSDYLKEREIDRDREQQSRSPPQTRSQERFVACGVCVFFFVCVPLSLIFVAWHSSLVR